MATARCAVCGKEHDELEPAFYRPDAFFAVPKDERERRVQHTDDLCAIDDEAFFIRCVVPVPVQGRELPYCWGFWVKVAREHFDEYRRYYSVDPPLDHPGFRGTLANQTRHLPPTLGLPAHVHLGQGRHRPRVMLLGEGHAFTLQQERGITPEAAHAWSEAAAAQDPLHPMLDPPGAEPFAPTLESHGWALAEPRAAGREAEPLPAAPRSGDLVKAPFEFLAAGVHGAVERRIELMWVLLDAVREDGWWSGTLSNSPFVPGPLDAGTRVWLRAPHVTAHLRAEDVPAEPAAGGGGQEREAAAGLVGRLAAWWRGVRGEG